MFKKLLSAIAVTTLVSGAVQAATVTTYTDRGLFEAASTVATETFDGFTSDVDLTDTTFDTGPFTLDGTGNFFVGNRIESNGADAFSVNGTPFFRGVGRSGSMFSVVFDTAVTAFGFDMFGINNGSERTRIVIGGDEFMLPMGGTAAFFGVTSDMAFSSVMFNVVAGGEDAGIDNISYGAATPVPLPGAALLMLSALGGLGFASRRRRTA